MNWNELLRALDFDFLDEKKSPEVFVILHCIPYPKDRLDLSEGESWTKMSVKDIRYDKQSNHVVIEIDTVKL